MPADSFVNMIKCLRQQEEVVLNGHIPAISDEAMGSCSDFLAAEYKRESLSYPTGAPLFSATAATWAAKTIYTTAQLILYRENPSSDLSVLLPGYNGPIGASEILSADLCLRFLPGMISQLRVINREDDLISILENILSTWHYSGITHEIDSATLAFDTIKQNRCLELLYTDRIIKFRNLRLAMQPAWRSTVSASLGNYSDVFWREFKTETTIHEL